MKVPEKSAAVSRAYLEESLNYQYSGRSFEYSPLLIARLLKGYKDKAMNLSWLFRGDNRIRISLTPDDVYNDLVGSNNTVKDIQTILAVMDVTWSIEDFIKGYATYKKQRMRINKILEDVETVLPLLPGNLLSKYANRSYSGKTSNKYKEQFSYSIDLDNTVTYGSVMVTNNTVIPTDSVSIKLSSSFYSTHNMESIIGELSSEDVILSLDVNDYITCSSGSCSSCLRIDGQHHLGWMQHFLSDFSIIAFTHSNKNEFNKTGRMFMQVKVTEDSQLYSKPGFKIGKTYGSINNTHRRLINDLIKERIEEAFGLGKPEAYSSGEFPYSMVSSNVSGGCGSHSRYAGYFDRLVDDKAQFFVYPSDIPLFPVNSHNYRYGPGVVFNYPDALDLNGFPTSQSNWGGGRDNTRTTIGMSRVALDFVTCEATGESVLREDAVSLGFNRFVSNAHLLATAGFGPIDAVEEAPLVVLEEQVDISDIDVDDF